MSVSLDCTLRTWSLAHVFAVAPEGDGKDDPGCATRIMAGNVFDHNAGITAGASGAESPVLEEGDPDGIAGQLGLVTDEEARELEELMDMGGEEGGEDGFYG